MREYGQAQCSIWQSDAFEACTDAGRLLAMYLLTGPHSNGLGCYKLPDGYVMEDLRWSSERVSQGFEELFRNGFAYRFSGVVFIPKYLKWNKVSNGNVAMARMTEFRALPKGEAKNRSAAELLKYCKHLGHEVMEELKGFDPPSETLLQTVTETVTQTVWQTRSDPIRSDPTKNQPRTEPNTPSACARATPSDSGNEPKPDGGGWKQTATGITPAGGDAWRDVTECDPHAYQTWLAWRADENDVVPPRVRLQDAKFLGGKGTPEQQLAFVEELIRLRFKRMHDPVGLAKGSVNGSTTTEPVITWRPTDDEEPSRANG